jgi:hypothetical protein
MHSLLPSAISVLLIAYLLSLPALSLQQDTATTTTTPKPLTYEACKEWFTALNGAWRKEKGDNCTMEPGKNVELYVDLVHPYKSKENSKFMEYLNTKKIAIKKDLNDYWNEDVKPPETHCDATKGLLCNGKEKIKFCRDCRDEEELKKNENKFREVCATITGIIQPEPSGRDPRVPREAKGK